MRLTGAAAPPPVLERARELARVDGAGAVAWQALRIFTQAAIGFPYRVASPRSFMFGGATYRYLTHGYNRSWLNERTVEVPIAQAAVARRSGRVLEVGNVLGHYGFAGHVVVDRYESAPGVINRDILDFDDDGRGFDLIVSISTVEHVGFDREPPAPRMAVTALERLRGLLAPGGELLVTIPVGYNDELDAAIFAADVGLEQIRALRRARWRNHWHEVEPIEVRDADYDFLACAARAILVCSGGGGR